MAPDIPPGGERQPLLPHSRELIISASFLYPLKGFVYFFSHPFLYPLLRARLVPAIVLSIAVLGLLFAFTYLPQVAFLALFHGPLAWVNAAFLVLGEGAAIIALLFEAFLVDETLVDIFDAVLINEGHLALVQPAREIHAAAPDPVKQLGKPLTSAQYSPFSFRQILEFIILLPLNLIPVVGTPLFLVLTGRRGGPLHHWRYFKFIGLRRKEKSKWIQRRRWRYTWFGTVALVLQLVPVLSMLFLMTTATGAAMWAADLEKQRQKELAGGQQPAGPSHSDDHV
ncbi:hypothetical protein FGG08_002345 [Glutinoglossum americanum]|uniref:Uncharacterized protein n=1 Tax=Glutinoglossum americanum TaxID=1670608 RepID=A0A9P8I4S8_9PEZI|nr:hypothetical protein FGG08_002345 [Glutinoglossum americanum]